jgi:hypothetical protein
MPWAGDIGEEIAPLAQSGVDKMFGMDNEVHIGCNVAVAQEPVLGLIPITCHIAKFVCIDHNENVIIAQIAAGGIFDEIVGGMGTKQDDFYNPPTLFPFLGGEGQFVVELLM